MSQQDIVDFTKPHEESLRFKIDDDIFEAVPSVGAQVLRDVINVTDLTKFIGVSPTDMTPEQAQEASSATRNLTERAMMFLDLVLLPESAQRFAERMRSTTEPITIQQAFEVWQWLIGRYGNRPTSPSLSSVNGHDGTGTSSTAGAPAGV